MNTALDLFRLGVDYIGLSQQLPGSSYNSSGEFYTDNDKHIAGNARLDAPIGGHRPPVMVHGLK